MTNIQEIQKTVIEIVSELMGVNEEYITRDTSFKDLNVESLDMVELVLDLEDAFTIQIEDDDVDELHTIGQCIDYIFKRTNL